MYTMHNGLNLYAYCLNNPSKYCDYFGLSVVAIIAILAAATIIGGVVGGVIRYNNGEQGWDLAKSIADFLVAFVLKQLFVEEI